MTVTMTFQNPYKSPQKKQKLNKFLDNFFEDIEANKDIKRQNPILF